MLSIRQGARWGGPLFILGMALACTGCGKHVYPVHGKITFEGKPLVGGGSIAFVPTGGQAGKSAGGTIDADGSYTLSTYGSDDGSMPGEFRVVIVQITAREPEPTPDGTKPANDAVTTVNPADRIPPIYADSQNSPLKTTVEAKSNELNFDLKRSAQPPPPVNRGAMGKNSLNPLFASLKP